MPWVEFWAATNCPSGNGGKETRYEWYDIRPKQSILKYDAEERIPYWMRDLERGCRYGFRVLRKLPKTARQELIKTYQDQKKHANSMLKLLQQ